MQQTLHKYILTTIMIAGLGGFTAGVKLAESVHKKDNLIPRIEEVEVAKEYIPPNRLEIECIDLNKDGKLETTIKVDGKSYLLKYGTKGKPTLLPYAIKIESEQK